MSTRDEKRAYLRELLDKLEKIENCPDPTFVEANESEPNEDATGVQIHKVHHEGGYKYLSHRVVNGDVESEQIYDYCPLPFVSDSVKYIALICDGDTLEERFY